MIVPNGKESEETLLFMREKLVISNGVLTWRKGRACGRNNGKQAGYVGESGYVRVSFLGRDYMAHRIVFALVNGAWPDGEIDHIDGNRSNNSIENLRVVDKTGNQRNRKKSSNNTSGVSGVRFHKDSGMWAAFIGNSYLGMFKSFDDAVAVRSKAEVAAGYSPSHGKR